MLKYYRCIVLMTIILVSVSTCCAIGQNISQARVNNSNLKIRFQQLAQIELGENIEFYGKVVDLQGDPVADANVSCTYRYYDPNMSGFVNNAEIVVKSNSKGLFKIEGLEGNYLFINNITKEGYEFNRMANPKLSFEYNHFKTNYGYQADVNNPTIFKMRKRGPLTYAVEYRFGFELEPDKSVAFDFINQSRQRLKNPIQQDVTNSTDLIIYYSYDESSDQYDVTFNSPGAGNGVVVTRKNLYSAPAKSYQSKIILNVKGNIPGDYKRYLYIKSRNPSIYTRFKVELNPYRGKVLLGVFCQYWTNPYGDGNLEFAEDIPGEASERFLSEAMKAIGKGELPKKPNDLEQIVRKAHEHKREEKKEIREMMLASNHQQLSIKIESNPFLSWQPGDQWEVKYQVTVHS